MDSSSSMMIMMKQVQPIDSGHIKKKKKKEFAYRMERLQSYGKHKKNRKMYIINTIKSIIESTYIFFKPTKAARRITRKFVS